MPLDIDKWDERIVKDYDHIATTFHRIWKNSRDVMNNEGRGSRFGNLTKEFAGAIRARLISKNFFVEVAADNPDFSKNAKEITIMVNSVSRTVDLKRALDDATEDSLWAGTGWLEVGHTMDLHSFNPMRSILYTTGNSFNPENMQDEYEPVPEEEVRAEVGNDLDNVVPFDPFQQPEMAKPNEPQLTFDPDVGSPWVTNVAPFFIVLPKETKKISDADYITKLVLISLEELATITSQTIPSGVVMDSSRFDVLKDETPGADYIDNPVVVAVTYIRRDRNAPEYNGWYLAHILGHPEVVLKSAPNPFGGMIPLIPAKSRSSMKILSKAWIEDLRPYTDNYAKIIEAAFKRTESSLAMKWSMGANGSVDQTNRARINNPSYNGEVKFQGGSAETFQFLDGGGITQDMIAGLNLVSKLAQGEAGQTDIDRGTPVKKITARQTEALLKTSELMMEAIRGPIVEAGNEAVLKLVHILNLFSSPREHVYRFGPHIVEIEPGGNDFTTSYEYKISVKDLDGPANAETQLLLVQFIARVAPLPQFQNIFNWAEIGNELRRAFGMGVETMAQLQTPGIAGERSPLAQPGGDVVNKGVQGEHPGRLGGDQGMPDPGAALAGLMNIR